ncbi:hypothetical protein [Deinococcus cavernae]|uniref:hypothetical protein n=1 Tax=Deinococcus cavernae TaxID=2320857 RepID=UPI0011C22C4E|nr:hypothetical protein [Deinococcus cavernae]
MYLEYDFSGEDSSVLEKAILVLTGLKSKSRRMFLSDVPEWLTVGMLDLSDPILRISAWGFPELPDLDNPSQRAKYDEFRQKDSRWDWEGWLSPWFDEDWQFEVDAEKSLLRLYVSEWPNGFSGPMNHLIHLADAREEIVPMLEFSK